MRTSNLATGETPQLQLVSEQGGALSGLEVEVWAHENLGHHSSSFPIPGRNPFGLVNIAAGWTDSQGCIDLEIGGRAFGVDDADADDVRLAIYKNGWLTHVEFIQELSPKSTVVVPENSRVPNEIATLRLVSPEGQPISGLTLRPIEPSFQSKAPGPYWRCRFGPSNAEGLLYLPRQTQDLLRFEVQILSGQEFLLSLLKEGGLPPVGEVTEIRVPGMIEIELDASGLSFATKARIRSLERLGAKESYWSDEESLRIPAVGKGQLTILGTSDLQLLLEPELANDQLVRMDLTRMSEGHFPRRHYAFRAKPCEFGKGRIENGHNDEPVEFPEYYKQIEALAVYREQMDDLQYSFRVARDVAADGTFALPLFPQDQSQVEIAFVGESGRSVEWSTLGEWAWRFDEVGFATLSLFPVERDVTPEFPSQSPRQSSLYQGRVVDSEGRPCPYARINVFGDQVEFDGLFSSTYRRKRLYAFCDAEGRFAFQSGIPFEEIEVSLGNLDGFFDFSRQSFEPNMVLVID